MFVNHSLVLDVCPVFSVDMYLKEVKVQNEQKNQGLQMVPTGSHIRDDEQVPVSYVVSVDFRNCYLQWLLAVRNPHVRTVHLKEEQFPFGLALLITLPRTSGCKEQFDQVPAYSL